jgi:hypothetical protein
MTIFNQQDARWAKEILGNTPYTIGRWGCLTTVLTMIHNEIKGSVMTPLQCAKLLKFTPDGLVIWSSLKEIDLKLVNRMKFRHDVIIQSALNSKDDYVALQVNNNHWVWLIGRYIPILGYRIVDPWTGTKCYTNRYKNNITGCAIISFN